MAGRSRVPCDARGARGAPVPLEHPGSLQNSSEAASPGSSGNTAPPAPRATRPPVSPRRLVPSSESASHAGNCVAPSGTVSSEGSRSAPGTPGVTRTCGRWVRGQGLRVGRFCLGPCGPEAAGRGAHGGRRAHGGVGGAHRAWGPQGRPEPLNSCPEPRWGDPRALKTPTLCLWRQAHGAWSIEIQDDRGRFAQPLCSSPTGGEPLTPGAQRCHPIKSNVGPKDFTRWPRIQQVTEGRGGGRGTARNSNVPKSRGN